MAWFKINGQKLTAIADAIRLYTGSEATMGLDAMAANVETVYSSGRSIGVDEGIVLGRQEGYASGKAEGIEQGKQAEYDRFWDAFQNSFNSGGYGYAFTGGGWTDATYNPKQPMVATGSCNYMFAMNYMTSTKVPITIDTSSKYCTHVFYTCYGLKTIPYLKVTEKVKTFNYWFFWCPELQEVNFTEDSVIGSNIALAQSSKLTNASVQSIIDCLKDLTGATAQTLTLHADVKANLTEEQLATITGKNWSVA